MENKGCKKCGKPAMENDNVCYECYVTKNISGKALKEQTMARNKHCESCGMPNSIEHGRCNNCGTYYKVDLHKQAERDLTTAVKYANTISSVFNTYFKG